MGIPSFTGILNGTGEVSDPPGFNKSWNRLLGTAQSSYDKESQFAPQYLNLDLQNLNTALNGNGDQQGLSSLISGARRDSITDFQTLSPEASGLMRQLNQQASTGLAQGSQLSPSDAYKISNSVRSDFANRGLGNSNPAMLAESLALFGGGEQLRDQRQGFAQNVAGMNQNQWGLMTAGAQQPLSAAMGLMQGSGPSLFGPNQAGNLMQSTLGNANAANMADAANRAGMYQAMDNNLTGWGASVNSSMSSM